MMLADDRRVLPPGGNWLTNDGARDLAAAIRGYWLSRGYLGIKVSVEPVVIAIGKENSVRIFTVRSNIGHNGYPPAGFDWAAL